VVSVKRSQTVGCMAAEPPESMHEQTQREISVAIIRPFFFPARREKLRFIGLSAGTLSAGRGVWAAPAKRLHPRAPRPALEV
jgi:hypothetical protein